MLRFVCMAAVTILNFVLQTTLLPHITVLGVTPDTGLVLTVSYGMLRGDVEGAVFGFLNGLLHDAMGGTLGVHAMLGMLVGFVCGKPFKDYFHDNYFFPFIMVLVATVCYQGMYYFTSILFRGTTDWLFYARVIILPKTIYTATLSVPFYALIYFLNARVEAFEHTRRRLFKKDEA